MVTVLGRSVQLWFLGISFVLILLLLGSLIYLVIRKFTRAPVTGSKEKSSRKQRPKLAGDIVDQMFGLKFVADTGQEWFFRSPKISIGRDPSNNIVLKDETVSAFHALIDFDEILQHLIVTDGGSLNGLLVNGQPTRTNILTDGATIQLGSTTLTFRDTGYIHST